MAKATTTKPSKTAAKPAPKAAPKAAAKPAPKAGENAATEAINQAALEGATGAGAKADAVKRAAELKAAELPERRFLVAPGRSVRKGGVLYRGDEGDHIDLSAIDSERFLGDGTILELDDANDDDGDDDGDDDTLTGAGGVTVPHPDTAEGKALQQQQEAEAAAKDAEQTGKGLPSGAENH